ncbi:MAG: hypothetical protein J3R72DRAFT_484602 [Linnemannia gamsii]|nr:MAG: hypothetical protein J3R72DRAFT_484602 [Linnemannia gamsii]
MSITLPPEILQGFTPYLNRYNLTVCVRVCQDWHAVFNPSLWKNVLLDDVKFYTRRSKIFRRGVEAGALLRSARWITTFHSADYDAVPPLVNFLGGSSNIYTSGITTLHLGSASKTRNKEYDFTHILRLFKLCPQLKSVKLSDDMLSRSNPIVQDLIAAIPATVETLYLTVCIIDYGVSGRDLPGVRGSIAHIPRPQPLIPFLPRLTTLQIYRFVDVTPSSWSLMFKNCPLLETLHLDRINSLEASRAISSAVRQFCPRLFRCIVRCGRESVIVSEAWANLLTASVGGWEGIWITAFLDYPFQLGPDCTDVLLRSGSRLKYLNLSCGATISFECVRKLYLMSPELVIYMGRRPFDRAQILQA